MRFIFISPYCFNIIKDVIIKHIAAYRSTVEKVVISMLGGALGGIDGFK